MNSKHKIAEQAFYDKAYSDNQTRRGRKYSWELEPSRSLDRIMRKNILKGAQRKMRVLDIGCGDGRHVGAFLKMGFDVVGVDFSSESVKLCRKRFKQTMSKFYSIDITNKRSLKMLGEFDIILDWSVLDHLRTEYQNTYKQNVFNALKNGGHLILTEFDEHLPGLFKNKKFKVVNGHYSRGFTIRELRRLFGDMSMVDSISSTMEDEINKYSFHTVLFRK
jgi:2-polyprenyl-3-methyl-5-hydroxy-6-metoxy-1,4-benzoquinol methylase